ncbi:MAG: C40 family peptidase [Leptolyngbya sp. SIO1D8]|nr:C40 family peptidase [Leptolyngbya sp. SIO1D8]
MVSFDKIQTDQEYLSQWVLNLYKSPDCQSLVTQAAISRHLRFLEIPDTKPTRALRVCLCEDDYPGWLAVMDLEKLTLVPHPYHPPALTARVIQERLSEVIHFAHTAMARSNTYLWGGTTSPNYDCSGLMQDAFASAGIMLPRDSYQQEAFAEPVAISDLQPGDLLFFGNRDRATHVALYLGNGKYIHSSGKDQGRNGIGVDSITDLSDPVSRAYHKQLRGAGRVSKSYQPTGKPIPCH